MGMLADQRRGSQANAGTTERDLQSSDTHAKPGRSMSLWVNFAQPTSASPTLRTT